MTARKKKPAPDNSRKLDAESVGGRERLMVAALKLAAEKRGLHGIGVRELGRMAGLNPNTFYRHFEDLEDLGVAILDAFTRDLGPALRSIRLSGLAPMQASSRTVEYVFDYALKNPEAFLVGVRELHGPSTRLREALRARIRDLGQEMVRDMIATQLAPAAALPLLESLAVPIVEHVFHRTLDYLEQPLQRAALVENTARYIDVVLMGAVTLHVGRK